MKRIFAAFILLPALIMLVGCGLLPPAATVSGDEFTCELYGSGRLRSITVLRDGSVVDKLKVSGVNRGADECGLEFIDLNFDGHEDIRITVSSGDSGTRYRSWLWSAEAQAFLTDKKLDRLISPVLDYENKSITAPYTSHIIEPAVGTEPETYIDEEGTVEYMWRQGTLTAVRKECITYYSENEIYCVAVWEIGEDGELAPVSERWLLPEQYERAGYAPIG